MTSHVRRHHTIYKSSGHVWQGRFKSFPVQEDNHLLTVLRYVLLNPVRPGLARTPREWPWSSLVFPGLTDPWPVSAPTDWGSWLGDYPSDTEFKELRKSLVRRAPYGDPSWQQTVAKQAGLEATLRPIGRPHNEIAISMPAAGK